LNRFFAEVNLQCYNIFSVGRLNIKLWARNADLSEANLTGADLNLTKLDATNFTQANLTGAVLPHGTIRE
jgi:uncharacterized protein YjbI with pentapeptide repeats